MNHFNESRSIPADPRPRPPVCDECQEPYNSGDLRIEYHHARVGIITICETCKAKYERDEIEEELS